MARRPRPWGSRRRARTAGGGAALLALLGLLACAATPRVPGEPGGAADPDAELLWSSRDVSVMVQVSDLEPLLGAPVPDARSASWHKQRRDDGALVLRYAYFSLASGIGLRWEVVDHPSVAAARAAMERTSVEVAQHAARDGGEVELTPDFYSWGDASVFAQVRSGGELGGQYFHARYGRITVSLSLAGVYFYEGAQFHQLVHRALSNLLFYHPGESHE